MERSPPPGRAPAAGPRPPASHRVAAGDVAHLQPGDLRHRIFEVPHGIDVSRFAERTGVPTRPSVLFLANVLYRKGVFTLLDAFPSVVERLPTPSSSSPGEEAISTR